MTIRLAGLVIVGCALAASTADAQFPQGGTGVPGTANLGVSFGNPAVPQAGFMPNFFNRVNQPLSPYLNLLRGGNVGVNYFYGVRPGLGQGAGPIGGGFGINPNAMGVGMNPVASGIAASFDANQPGIPLEPYERVAYIPSAGYRVTYGANNRLGMTPGLAGVRPNLGIAPPTNRAAGALPQTGRRQQR